nr:hypothetical protein [Tanacetum cinerariifolium]
MIAVNNQKDSVSPLSLAAKPKKGKSQTVSLTLPKSQGPKVLGALSKKRKRPKSKKPSTETNVTPPKPTEGTAKTTPRPKGSLRDKDSGGNIPLVDMEQIHPTFADLLGTGAKYQVDQTQSTRLRYQSLSKNKGRPSHERELDTQPLVLSTYADVRAFLLSDDEAQESEDDILGVGKEIDEEPQTASITKTHHHYPSPQADKLKYLRKMSNALFAEITKDNWEKHREAAVNYVDLKVSIDDHYDENIAYRDQTDKLVEASMSSLEKSSNTISDLYKGLNIITKLLKEIKNAIKDDSVIKKISEATESLTKFSTNIIDLQSYVKVPYMINGKMCYLTDKEIQAYLDIEEKLRKAAEEERLLAISKPEVIKVVQEEAEKIGLDPNKITSAKAGEKFKKTQEAEHQTINNRLKPETITDIKIHPKTKPVVITAYIGTDGRNFDVHKHVAFGAFGISELDELREIIPKKKNTVVQDLMNSLSRRYERIRKILEETGIESTHPAPAPEQASFKSSRKKKKHMELEPEAFQRWSDVDKVRMEALVSYLVAASMVKSPEKARFNMKLKKLIAEHPDQEKLKSKKVKLEAFGYEMK